MKPDHTATILITMTRRWWVVPYLRTLKVLCFAMGTEPDMPKVIAFVVKYGWRLTIKEN